MLLLFLVISPFTCCFSKETDWKLQALESTELIGLPVKSNMVFFCVCVCFRAQHLLVVTDSGKSQHKGLTKLQRKEGSKERKGGQPEHNLETMWHIFPFSACTGAYPVSQPADTQQEGF